jgi:hypothetical protein
MDIASSRLHNQCLTATQFEKAEDVVSWFGAMQSQDFAAAKWALALRSKNQTNVSIEQAFNEGKILRTHIMRPTWHFVAPEDIRWLLTLTSARVHRFNGSYYRKSGLDKSIFEKSNKVLAKVLQGKQLTRAELHDHLTKAHIPTQDLGLTFTIMQAELDGIIVSGPRRGKQFTYMLLDERVAETKQISNEEALFELTKRYFQSHGPAQVKDFSWWSGLTLTDVRKGIDMMGSKLKQEKRDEKVYYFFETAHTQEQDTIFLVPGFDEYFISYTDRSDTLDKMYAKELNQGGGMVNGAVVANGKMVGGWRRTFEKKSVVIALRLFEKITQTQKQLLDEQAKRFGAFISMPVVIKQS